MSERPDTEQISARLKNNYKRPELNALANDHYGIADPVGFRTQDELIAAMVAANHDRAESDAGFEVPETAPDEAAPDTSTDETQDTDEPNYTADELDAIDPDALGALASDVFGIDPTTHESRKSLQSAILAGQEADADDDTDDEPEPELPEGIVLIVGIGPANRTAFWEQHKDHPGGEVFIRGGERAEAFLTVSVHRAEKNDRIRVVDGK